MNPGVTSRLRVAVVILWIGVILLGSTTKAETLCNHVLSRIEEFMCGYEANTDDGPEPDRFWEKKAIHVALFSFLSVVISRALTGTGPAVWTVMAVAAVVVGCGSEAVQLLYPSRTPMLRDVLINSASGILTACVLVRKRSADRNRAAGQVSPCSCSSPTNY